MTEIQAPQFIVTVEHASIGASYYVRNAETGRIARTAEGPAMFTDQDRAIQVRDELNGDA